MVYFRVRVKGSVRVELPESDRFRLRLVVSNVVRHLRS